MHRHLFKDDTLASETPVQPWLPQLGCHSQNQNLNLLKLNQNNSCCKSKSIPIIDPQTRMEIVVNDPKNLDPSADIIQNKSHRNATAEKRRIDNLKASENEDSSTRPRPFLCSTPVGHVNDGSDVLGRMSPVESMSGKPSIQRFLTSGKHSHQMSLMSGRPSHQVSLTSGKPADVVKEESDISRRMSQSSPMLGKPRGAAGSVDSSFTRMSCRSQTGGKQRTLLQGKLNSRLAGLEAEGKQVIVGLEMLEKRVKALLEEAKLTAEELDSEGDAMDQFTALSQYLVQVEDEITMISASLSQWLDVSSDSEEVDDSEVSNVGVINDENIVKEVNLGGYEGNGGFVNKELQKKMINIGNKVKDVILEDKVDKKKNIEILNNVSDTDKNDNTVLEGNVENCSQVNGQIETAENQSNSSDGNFISFTDLINGKEMLDINENVDITKKNSISYMSSTQIRKLQNVNEQVSAELKQKLKALHLYKTDKINEDRVLISGLANLNKPVNDENIVNMVEGTVVEMPNLNKEKDEEDELEFVNEIRSDSLGSTWEDGNTRPSHEDGNTRPFHEDGNTRSYHEDGNIRPFHEDGNFRPSHEDGNTKPFHEDVTEKSKLSALSSDETKSKVREWLNSQCDEVNTSFPQTSSVRSFRAKLRPKNDVKSKNMKVNSDNFTDDVVKLGPLKILEDENCSFLFKLSAIENPGKFFVHPVQDEMAYLNQIHKEIKNHPRKIPDEQLVARDTVWSMFNQGKQRWCRVRVESRSSTCASVRYIDLGTIEEKVELWFLRQLPDTWVRRLPALAVQCNLGGCSPVGAVWDQESTAALQKILGNDKEHRAVTVGESNGSLDLILLVKGKIVNQQMVACGFASSQVTDFKKFWVAKKFKL